MGEQWSKTKTHKPVVVTFLGTGDAFGSGGRLSSCVHVHAGRCRFLLDCGPSVLPAMKRAGLAPADIDIILISHLHGDHTGGIPFILLESQLKNLRARPLTIAGPQGISRHVVALMDALFPGFSPEAISYPLEFKEFMPGVPLALESLTLTALPAVHSPASNPHSLRIETLSKIIAYSGDTEWNDSLASLCKGSHLFICECFRYDTPASGHIDYPTLMRNVEHLDTARIVLVHMGESMIANMADVRLSCASDGMVVEL